MVVVIFLLPPVVSKLHPEQMDGGWRSSPLMVLCSNNKSWISRERFYCVATHQSMWFTEKCAPRCAPAHSSQQFVQLSWMLHAELQWWGALWLCSLWGEDALKSPPSLRLSKLLKLLSELRIWTFNPTEYFYISMQDYPRVIAFYLFLEIIQTDVIIF